MDEKTSMSVLSERIKQVSEHYGLPIAPQRLVHDLSVGERQRVEIVRCLLQNPKLLIMDEPTSVLTPQAVEKLFVTLRQLASEGCSILYISHKLDEIQSLCDSATVLRHGAISGDNPKEETVETMAQLMIGRALPQYEHASHETGDIRLQINNLSAADRRSVWCRLIRESTCPCAPVKSLALQVFQAAAKPNYSPPCPVKNAPRAPIWCKLWDKECRSYGRGATATRAGTVFRARRASRQRRRSRHESGRKRLLTAYQSPKFGMLRRGLIQRKKTRELADRCIKSFKSNAKGNQSTASSLSVGNLQKFIIMGREFCSRPNS